MRTFVAELMPGLDELGTRILLSISAATLLIGATTNQPTCDNIASSQHFILATLVALHSTLEYFELLQACLENMFFL